MIFYLIIYKGGGVEGAIGHNNPSLGAIIGILDPQRAPERTKEPLQLPPPPRTSELQSGFARGLSSRGCH